MLALVQIGVGLLVLAMVAIILTVLVITAVTVLQPILDYITKPVPGFLGRAIKWTTRPATNKVKAWYREWVAALARKAQAAMQPLVLLQDQLAEDTQRVAGTLGDMAEQTWRALWVLNHETIPRKITAALVPVKAQLTRHTNRLDDLEDLNRRTAVVIGTGLRSLPWGAPGSYVGNFDAWWDTYRHLWTQFFTIAQPRIAELWAERVTNLRDRFNELETRVTLIREEALPAIRQRLGRLEDSLGELLSDPATWIFATIGLSLVPALSAASVRTGFGSLFCRNTQDVAGRLCRTDLDFMAQLLAGTLIFALALDPRIIARAGQTLYGGAEAVFRETALR